MKPKILILTPVYKRPEIFELFLNGYERIRHQADLLIVRSVQDPYYDEIMALLMKHEIRSICFPNDDLGRKKNAGLNYALKFMEFDYLMDLGSDNLVSPNYLWHMFPHGDEIYQNMLGLKHLYIWDYLTDQFYFIEDYAFEHTYGAGRIYPRRILKKNFWPEGNAGMDIGLVKKHKLIEDVFYRDNEPFILDIKTRTNINPMEIILSRNENKAQLITDKNMIEKIKNTFAI